MVELFDRLRQGLAKTRQAIAGRLEEIFGQPVDEAFFEDLEILLVQADLGASTAKVVVERLRAQARGGAARDQETLRDALEEILAGLLGPPAPLVLEPPPAVILALGVNGVGKTTTVAKLAHHLRGQGKKVLLAAADTFRAAAIDQLEIWAGRVGCDLIRHREGGDPAAVVFDAAQAARARHMDVLLVDTAGRLHTKTNLMEELKKIDRVVARELPGAPVERLLILDATTGQNGLRQARVFTGAVGVTVLVLAKLDGTAKGGVAVAIAQDLKLPVKFVGIGERLDDLQPFDPHAFAHALVAPE